MQTETHSGANPDAQFDAWWEKQGSWVEPPNQRRGGESGVQILTQSDPSRPKLYCKRQIGHLYYSLRHPFGQPTALREQQVYLSFDRLGIRIPKLHYCGARKRNGQWQALFVTEALGDDFISFEQWLEDASSTPPTPELRQAVLNQVGIALARMHRARWQHSCCYPKHIFVRALQEGVAPPQVDVALLDLEKCRRRWRVQDASQHDLKQLWRHRGKMPESDWEVMLQAYRGALGSLVMQVCLYTKHKTQRISNFFICFLLATIFL